MGSSKLLIFTNSYSPVLGGIQTVTSQLANGLSDDNNVRVITNKYPKKLKGKELVDGIHVNRFYLGNYYVTLNSPKMILKGVFYWVQPFFDGYSKLKYVPGFLNKVVSYLIIVAIQYNWRKGVLDQIKISKN